MIVNAETISPKLAREVLHHFHSDEGVDGGFGLTLLLSFIGHCDESWKARIALGFPAEVAAVKLMHSPGGEQTLRVMASLPMSVAL